MPSKKKTPTEVEASVIVPPAPSAEPRKARVPRAASVSVRKGTSHKGTGTPAARQSARNIPTKRVSKPRSRASNAALAIAGENIHPVTPEHNEISLLAYSYWEARGCQGGSPEEDWYRAEQEIQKRKKTGSSPESSNPGNRSRSGSK